GRSKRARRRRWSARPRRRPDLLRRGRCHEQCQPDSDCRTNTEAFPCLCRRTIRARTNGHTRLRRVTNLRLVGRERGGDFTGANECLSNHAALPTSCRGQVAAAEAYVSVLTLGVLFL